MRRRLHSSADRAVRRFSAPRSLKVEVNCRFSNLSQTSQPQISVSVRLWLQSVAMTEPRSVAAAASISAGVTANFLEALLMQSIEPMEMMDRPVAMAH